MGSIVLVLLVYSGLLAPLHSKKVSIYALGMRGAVNTASRTSKSFFWASSSQDDRAKQIPSAET